MDSEQYQQYLKDKEAEREEITRKINEGQTFGEHAREIAAFDIDLIRRAKITVRKFGEDIVLLGRNDEDE